MSKRDKRFLNLAMRIAEKSECRQRHGSVIVKNSSILGMGFNKDRNHPSIVTPGRAPVDCAVHSEVAALKRAGDVRGATIYNARVNKQGEPMLSKPCDNCQAAIDEAGIKRIVWTE